MKSFSARLALAAVFFFITCTAFAQEVFPTVGIIGTATPLGWDASTAMNVNASSPHDWTLTLQLTQGELKFRANDDWTVNWGGSEFPSGTGTRNGNNLQIPTTSYYTITFNDVTGNYNFQSSTPVEYPTVGLIGSGTPGGWDASNPMTKDSSDPHAWSLSTITLSAGEIKFRANNAWDVNWGGSSFPAGTANQNGSNIPITAGEYRVTFNDVTREYNFENLNPTEYTTVGIIGNATAKGWEASTPMQNISGNSNQWTITTYLSAGEMKFRADDSWMVNWGASSFPSGQAVPNGPNLAIAESGYYTIQFNDLSLSYSFLKLNPVTYATVGLIGTATSNGWDASTAMTQGPDGHTWTLTNFTLFDGEAKFRANNNWDVNWGGNSFPSGLSVQGGPNIPVAAGSYTVTFNDVTREYSFIGTGGPVAGIVVLNPAFPGADEPITITYDANQGTSALRNAQKVYMHSGVILSGADGTTWNNVVGNWGQDDGVGQMTLVPGETNKWQITIPSIREYYNVDSGVPVFRLGMVFRNAEGTQTGKSASDGDIFVNVDPGDFVRFISPLANQVFGVSGEQLQINAEASEVADAITVEINQGNGFNTVATASNSQTISYAYTYNTATNVVVKITANLGGTVVVSEKQLTIVLRQPNTVAALPAGMKNGINYHADDETKATLVLLAPRKQFVYAVGDFNNWQIDNAYQMHVTPDGEYFWIELTNLQPEKEYIFQYWVEGTIKVGDPYADKVADPYNDHLIPADVYPNALPYTRTQDGIATVLQTGQESYQWISQGVQGGRPANENLVVYELLVRDFLGSHSYNDLADTLSYLKRLGVNAIELLPIMEFEGNESWGYNPSYLFAPDKYYGTKNDLKAFIDRAHREGFVVILDMVLNHHFGQSPLVRMYWDEMNGKPSTESPWFNPDATHPFNVGYDFNHESAYTKRYIDDVNRYWLEEYRFDGYRFDLSKGFTQVNNPNDVGAWSAYDQSRINILTRMTDKIREVDASAYVIMEHLAVNEEEKVLADRGIMLWGNMNHSYNDVVNGDVTEDLNWTLSSTRGWNQKNLVPYMESHDEERLMVRALNSGASNGDYNIKQLDVALERVKLASAFFFTLPGPKMIWQFGELGYDISIDYNGRTGNKPIPWGNEDGLKYHEQPERVKLYKATAAIINLVNDHNNVFEQGQFSWTPTGQFRRITISHGDMNVTIVGNFGVTEGNINPGFQHTGTWYDFFAGRRFSVASTNSAITLEPGEFHIYTDQPVDFPERGLVKTRVAIFAPENLQSTLDGAEVLLSWEDTSDGESGFTLERKAEEEGHFAIVATLSPNAEQYIDASTVDGITYDYRIKTISDVRPHSDWSNTISVDLPLSSPAELMTESVTKQSVSLMWKETSSNEDVVIVERSNLHGNVSSSYQVVAELPANATEFTDDKLKAGQYYSYRVFVKDQDEISTSTNEITVRPAKSKATFATVYPNPASSQLLVTSTESGEITFRIMTLQGEVVSEFKLTAEAETRVDVSKWKDGMYIIQGNNGRAIESDYLIIRK